MHWPASIWRPSNWLSDHQSPTEQSPHLTGHPSGHRIYQIRILACDTFNWIPIPTYDTYPICRGWNRSQYNDIILIPYTSHGPMGPYGTGPMGPIWARARALGRCWGGGQRPRAWARTHMGPMGPVPYGPVGPCKVYGIRIISLFWLRFHPRHIGYIL